MGRRYLDFGAGIAVNAFGHANPKLVAGADRAGGQALAHLQPFRVPGQESLAAKLVGAHLRRHGVLHQFGRGGHASCAFKMARRYHFVNGHPERFRIVTFEGAFHGRTLAGIAAGGKAKYLEGFGPKVEGFDQVPPHDLKALKRRSTRNHRRDHDRADPGRGRRAARSTPEFLRALRKLCDEKGLLLIFDEIQTGIGPHRQILRP